MNAAAIREELREGKSQSLTRRRRIALLSAVGAVNFSVLSLYQVGVIRKLPDFPGEIFDSNGVNASEEAYALGLSDAPLGLASYAANIILASTKGSARTGRSPGWDMLLGGAVLAGAGSALYYLYQMLFEQKKLCTYCLVGAAINLAMVPPAWKEMQGSLRPDRQPNPKAVQPAG